MTDHKHDHHNPQALRAQALEDLLIERGLLKSQDVDDVIVTYNERVGPMNGARVVAKAWTDADFRQRLLTDATEAVSEFKFEGGQMEKLVVVENTDGVHNVVVCTLCSCYPWAVLGLPPKWYKDPAYRSRVVREPRAVLQEFGTVVPEHTQVKVWDSSAEVRYMVLPAQPDHMRALSEAELALRITRDSMIGVQILE